MYVQMEGEEPEEEKKQVGVVDKEEDKDTAADDAEDEPAQDKEESGAVEKEDEADEEAGDKGAPPSKKSKNNA